MFLSLFYSKIIELKNLGVYESIMLPHPTIAFPPSRPSHPSPSRLTELGSTAECDYCKRFKEFRSLKRKSLANRA